MNFVLRFFRHANGEAVERLKVVGLGLLISLSGIALGALCFYLVSKTFAQNPWISIPILFLFGTISVLAILSGIIATFSRGRYWLSESIETAWQILVGLGYFFWCLVGVVVVIAVGAGAWAWLSNIVSVGTLILLTLLAVIVILLCIIIYALNEIHKAITSQIT